MEIRKERVAVEYHLVLSREELMILAALLAVGAEAGNNIFTDRKDKALAAKMGEILRQNQ